MIIHLDRPRCASRKRTLYRARCHVQIIKISMTEFWIDKVVLYLQFKTTCHFTPLFLSLSFFKGPPWGIYKGQDGFYMYIRGTYMVKLTGQTLNSNLTYIYWPKNLNCECKNTISAIWKADVWPYIFAFVHFDWQLPLAWIGPKRSALQNVLIDQRYKSLLLLTHVPGNTYHHSISISLLPSDDIMYLNTNKSTDLEANLNSSYIKIKDIWGSPLCLSKCFLSFSSHLPTPTTAIHPIAPVFSALQCIFSTHIVVWEREMDHGVCSARYLRGL